MVYIKINIDKLISDLVKYLIPVANGLANQMLGDMKARFRNSHAKDDNDIEEAESDVQGLITSVVANFAFAIMDSYGTGEKMDSYNPNLNDYISSELWNTARGSGKSIQGRPAGQYINIFGESVTSKGELEGKTINRSTPPSYAIQNTEIVYFSAIIEQNLSRELNDWLPKNLPKYFYN